MPARLAVGVKLGYRGCAAGMRLNGFSHIAPDGNHLAQPNIRPRHTLPRSPNADQPLCEGLQHQSERCHSWRKPPPRLSTTPFIKTIVKLLKNKRHSRQFQRIIQRSRDYNLFRWHYT